MKMSEICTSNHPYRRNSGKRIISGNLGAAKRLALRGGRSEAQWSDLRFLFWFFHGLVILRGCDFIDLSREVIDL
jgi:hypothetical protein